MARYFNYFTQVIVLDTLNLIEEMKKRVIWVLRNNQKTAKNDGTTGAMNEMRRKSMAGHSAAANRTLSYLFSSRQTAIGFHDTAQSLTFVPKGRWKKTIDEIH